ncbi:MAG: Hpt domain-containing protein, partial [Oscillospiraceae bacterium]
MSSFDPSMKPMLEMFIYETTTILEQLDEIMLQAEKDKNFGSDEINEIFRFMHTIKGSSAMMGIESITTLAHAVEDVFYTLRQTPDKIGLINEAIFDIVFQASDYFKAEVEAIQNDDFEPQDSSLIIAQLKDQVAIMNGDVSQPKSPTISANDGNLTTQQTEDYDKDLYQVRVFFVDDCQMENLRSFMLLTQLKDWCDYIDSVPQSPENDSSLCEQIINDGLLIKFKTSLKPQDVYNVIETSINVKSYDIIEQLAYQPTLAVNTVNTTSI